MRKILFLMVVALLVFAVGVSAAKLDVKKDGTGTGKVTSSPSGINCGTGTACSKTYGNNIKVTLTAQADPGSKFDKWAGCDAVSSDKCLLNNVNTAKTVTATFTKATATTTTYKLTVTKSGSGTVKSGETAPLINCGNICNYNYASGTSVTLTATPAAGYVLSAWGGACSGTAGCTVTMNAAKTVTAAFTLGAVCGDGKKEGTEQCDDRNTVTETQCTEYGGQGNFCNADCSQPITLQCPRCGDGQLNGNEVCDGNSQACTVGGYAGSQSCTARCTAFGDCVPTERLGDGFVNGPEECDPGATRGREDDVFTPGWNVCPASLGFAAGKGYMQCTDGLRDTSACTTCGNGEIDAGEECDGTSFGAATCQSKGFAGGGQLGCTSSCLIGTEQCIVEMAPSETGGAPSATTTAPSCTTENVYRGVQDCRAAEYSAIACSIVEVCQGGKWVSVS